MRRAKPNIGQLIIVRNDDDDDREYFNIYIVSFLSLIHRLQLDEESTRNSMEIVSMAFIRVHRVISQRERK